MPAVRRRGNPRHVTLLGFSVALWSLRGISRRVQSAVEAMVDIQEQDQWISYLSECKQLSENDVKRLCEKVRGLRQECRR